jgi:hypothetical protein
MKSSDLTVTILIVVTFLILYFANIFVVGYKKIQDNWPIYRCNPLVMPFAGVFGFDAGENFAYCIQNMQSAYMGILTLPLSYNLDVMGSTGMGLNSSLLNVKGMFSQTRNFITSTVQTVFNVFINMMVEIQRLFMTVKDLFGKMTGVMAVTMYTIDGSIKTMNSTWNGPPGQIARMLCFHPDTLLQLQDGSYTTMKQVPLNAHLKNGTVVAAKMEISNIDQQGSQVEPMYRLEQGENHSPILVSGSHLIYSQEKDQFIPVKDLNSAQLTDTPCPTLACLITSDHIIPIGEWIFHDWEDNNGSIAKTIPL